MKLNRRYRICPKILSVRDTIPTSNWEEWCEAIPLSIIIFLESFGIVDILSSL